MLVLQRNKEESIIVYAYCGEIEIKVLKIEPHRVSLGISAPKSVSILRKELIKEERE